MIHDNGDLLMIYDNSDPAWDYHEVLANYGDPAWDYYEVLAHLATAGCILNELIGKVREQENASPEMDSAIVLVVNSAIAQLTDVKEAIGLAINTQPEEPEVNPGVDDIPY